MYCNYCDSVHRSKFSLKEYAINSTYDAANLAWVKDDLYNYDTFNRNYEGYMDYWCTLLWDESKLLLLYAVSLLKQAMLCKMP